MDTSRCQTTTDATATTITTTIHRLPSSLPIVTLLSPERTTDYHHASLLVWSSLGLIMLPVATYLVRVGAVDGSISAWTMAVTVISIALPCLVQGPSGREHSGTLTSPTQERPLSRQQQQQQQKQQQVQEQEQRSNDSQSQTAASVSKDTGQPQEQHQLQQKDCFSEQERNNHVAKYIDGRILYADGSPAHVPAGESSTRLPTNFIDFRLGNHKLALAQWQATQQWRRDRNVYQIHTRPDPCFRPIKEAYPHVCHGKSKQGWVVMYEFPGRMDLKRMFHSDISNEDILHHDVFVLEYVANVLHPKIMATSPPDVLANGSGWGMVGVLDLSGATAGDFFNRDVIHYLTLIAKVSDDHYPLHVKKLFMINAPFWMAHFFKVIKPILPKTLVVDVLSGKDYVKALREYIDDAELAQEFGGSSPYKLGEHPYELDLVQLATNGTAPRGAPANVVDAQQDTKEEDSSSLDNLSHDNATASKEATTAPTVSTTSTTMDVTTQPQPEARLFWPLSLPSLCSTFLSTSSGEDGDGMDDMSSDFGSVENSRPIRTTFMRTGGPLRPRLPSFEPVVSPDEEERYMATAAHHRNRASTETSFTEGDRSTTSGDDAEEEEALYSFLGCDSLFSTVLAACG